RTASQREGRMDVRPREARYPVQDADQRPHVQRRLLQARGVAGQETLLREGPVRREAGAGAVAGRRRPGHARIVSHRSPGREEAGDGTPRRVTRAAGAGPQGRQRRRPAGRGIPRPVSDTLRRVQRAIDFVEAHLFEELPLTAIAERGSCSPWHFHRLFVALTGETPATYVWKRRLSEICRRLIETRHPLVGVALPCGFEPPSPRRRPAPLPVRVPGHVPAALHTSRRRLARAIPAHAAAFPARISVSA